MADTWYRLLDSDYNGRCAGTAYIHHWKGLDRVLSAKECPFTVRAIREIIPHREGAGESSARVTLLQLLHNDTRVPALLHRMADELGRRFIVEVTDTRGQHQMKWEAIYDLPHFPGHHPEMLWAQRCVIDKTNRLYHKEFNKQVKRDFDSDVRYIGVFHQALEDALLDLWTTCTLFNNPLLVPTGDTGDQ